MWNKPTLLEHLSAAITQCRETANSASDPFFFENRDNKWSVAENLIHLSKSAKAVHKGLANGTAALTAIFGVPAQFSADYEAVVKRYQAALAGGLIAPGAFKAQTSPEDTLASVLESYDQEHTELVKAFGGLTEEELDQVQLPHPALGNMTLREMAFFMVFHIGHHEKAVERIMTL